MKTFSFIWTDKLGAAIAKASRQPYPIECHYNSEMFNAILYAVNQGIDSRLQALHFTQGKGEHGRYRIVFDARSVPVLVRRLMEGDEESQILAGDICGTLGIELI